MMRFLLDTLKSIGIIGCTLFSGNNDIPESEVPSVIRNSFDTEFPEARKVEWEQNRGNFEVDFELNKADYSALFNKAGEMLMIKREIPIDALPGPVKERLKKEYDHYRIEGVEQVEKEGITYFQVELEGRILEKKEVFSKDGQVAMELYWD